MTVAFRLMQWVVEVKVSWSNSNHMRSKKEGMGVQKQGSKWKFKRHGSNPFGRQMIQNLARIDL